MYKYGLRIIFLPWESGNRMLQVNSDVNKYVVVWVRQKCVVVAGNLLEIFFVLSQLQKLHYPSGWRWLLNSFHFVLVIFVS